MSVRLSICMVLKFCVCGFYLLSFSFFFFFFNDTATTEIYTLSLHDALPISQGIVHVVFPSRRGLLPAVRAFIDFLAERSEEHTSELQSRSDLVCRLLLEKKKTIKKPISHYREFMIRIRNNHEVDYTLHMNHL